MASGRGLYEALLVLAIVKFAKYTYCIFIVALGIGHLLPAATIGSIDTFIEGLPPWAGRTSYMKRSGRQQSRQFLLAPQQCKAHQPGHKKR